MPSIVSPLQLYSLGHFSYSIHYKLPFMISIPNQYPMTVYYAKLVQLSLPVILQFLKRNTHLLINRSLHSPNIVKYFVFSYYLCSHLCSPKSIIVHVCFHVLHCENLAIHMILPSALHYNRKTHYTLVRFYVQDIVIS